VAGGGVAYTLDAWTFGAQYSHQLAELDGSSNDDLTLDRAVLTANYALGPGIDLDGEVGYTWVNTDSDDADIVDNYDGLEIGIGTAITF
jgi:predicted porin